MSKIVRDFVDLRNGFEEQRRHLAGQRHAQPERRDLDAGRATLKRPIVPWMTSVSCSMPVCLIVLRDDERVARAASFIDEAFLDRRALDRR